MFKALMSRLRRKKTPQPTIRDVREALSKNLEEFENTVFMLSMIPEVQLSRQQTKYLQTAHFNLFSFRDEIWVIENEQKQALKKGKV